LGNFYPNLLFWPVNALRMGVQVLDSKLHSLVISCSIFLKLSGRMRVNKPKTLVYYLGKTSCVKKVSISNKNLLQQSVQDKAL